MARRTDFEARRRDQQIARDADEVELEAVRLGFSTLDQGIADERIADTLQDEALIADQGQLPEWAERDQQLDSAVSDIGTEVQRRSALMGDAYPFEIVGNHLEYRESKSLAYELCLAIANAPSLTRGDLQVLTEAFERLALDVCRLHLARGAVGLRTGWRYEPLPCGLKPSTFKEIMDYLNASTHEWKWGPKGGLPPDPSQTDLKDLGVDFVVWKPAPDKRAGQLFLVGQCACGHEWEGKYYDVDRKRMAEWFETITYVDFVRVFALPHHIRNSYLFTCANERGGLTFDRARIAMIAEDGNNAVDVRGHSTGDAEQNIKLVVPGFRECLGAA